MAIVRIELRISTIAHHLSPLLASFSCISLSTHATGFRAEGLHLPTPPPIPEAIAKSLQYHLNRTPQILQQQQQQQPQPLQQLQQLNQNAFNNQNQQSQTQFQSSPQATSRQYQRPSDVFNSNDNTGRYDPNRN